MKNRTDGSPHVTVDASVPSGAGTNGEEASVSALPCQQVSFLARGSQAAPVILLLTCLLRFLTERSQNPYLTLNVGTQTVPFHISST